MMIMSILTFSHNVMATVGPIATLLFIIGVVNLIFGFVELALAGGFWLGFLFGPFGVIFALLNNIFEQMEIVNKNIRYIGKKISMKCEEAS